MGEGQRLKGQVQQLEASVCSLRQELLQVLAMLYTVTVRSVHVIAMVCVCVCVCVWTLGGVGRVQGVGGKEEGLYSSNVCYHLRHGQEVRTVGHERTQRSCADTHSTTITMHRVYSQSLCCGLAVTPHDGSSLMHTSSLRPCPLPPPGSPNPSFMAPFCASGDFRETGCFEAE